MVSKEVYYWISIQILSEISGTSCNKIRKTYRSIIKNDCVPLSEIDPVSRDTYVRDYLLHNRLIDFSFLDAIKDYTSTTPLKNPDVQALFREMEMMRRGMAISETYASSGISTIHLKQLASEYGISYSTFSRRRSLYMNTTPLYRALTHDVTNEDTVDRYKTCCFYCRDLIIFKHEMVGKISSAKIYRDIRAAAPFPCSECPYNPAVKQSPKEKNEFIPAATCMRKSEYMVKPNCDDTVLTIVNRIPEQQDVLAWEGVRSWALKYHFTPPREKPRIVNQVWFSDHKLLDVQVRVKQMPDGTWKTQRPWITAILDAATDVMVAYILSLNPNSDCISECFARACAFTVDTPYCGIPDYFYIDNGKDYRSKKMKGLPNSEDAPLYLNREFGEAGILEWFGIRVIHALPYRGCSKTIERIWKTIDEEWIRGCPGYCGSKPELRPPGLNDDIKKNRIYTFEQFADYFAETIYPEYNNFAVTKESPNTLYAKLPKASSFVPTWRTLAVLKSVSATRVIRPKGIQYGQDKDGRPKLYWCPELAPLIEKEDSTQYRIFAFDTPFNRNISVVHGHKYIGEAHLIEKLNVVEENRYKVVNHIKEQNRQRKYYSDKIKQLHSIIIQSDILDYIPSAPPVDNIRYGQAIDTDRDKEMAVNDNCIPEELKKQAETYSKNYLIAEDTNKPGKITQLMREIGKNARNNA